MRHQTMGRKTAREINAQRATIAQVLAAIIAIIAIAAANPRIDDAAVTDFYVLHFIANGDDSAFNLMP